jgi:hypothetical protein
MFLTWLWVPMAARSPNGILKRYGVLLQLRKESIGQTGCLAEQIALSPVILANKHRGFDDVLVEQSHFIARPDTKSQPAEAYPLGLLADSGIFLPAGTIPIRPNQSLRLRPRRTSRLPVRKASD